MSQEILVRSAGMVNLVKILYSSILFLKKSWPLLFSCSLGKNWTNFRTIFTVKFRKDLWRNHHPHPCLSASIQGILMEHEMLEVAVVQIRTLRRAKLQSDHHHQKTNTGFLQAECPSCLPTNSVKALKRERSVEEAWIKTRGLPSPQICCHHTTLQNVYLYVYLIKTCLSTRWNRRVQRRCFLYCSDLRLCIRSVRVHRDDILARGRVKG